MGTRAKIEIDQLGGALADAGRHIVAGDDEIGAPIIPPAHDNMRVRMAGVEMVDRDPIELRPQVLFHPFHQPPCERFQIVILIAVLGRDDEAELMAIASPAFAERLAVDSVRIAPVERAAFARARGPVALEIAQVCGGGRRALAGELDDACLDDDTATVQRRMTAAASEQPPDTRAAPDPRARERPSRDAQGGRAAARKIGGGEDTAEIAPGALAALLTLTPEARFKAVVVGHYRDSGGVEGPACRAARDMKTGAAKHGGMPSFRRGTALVHRGQCQSWVQKNDVQTKAYGTPVP